MDTEKKELYKILEKVDELSKHHLGMWVVCSFLLFICMFFDAVPYRYWAVWIENLYTYDIGNVIAIIVVVWTFTVSLSTYWLDKLGKRYYGISMSDVLLFDLRKEGIFALVGMVLTELFFLIVAAVSKWEITIVMIAIQQFFIMIYLFLLVCAKTSYSYILSQINMEIERCTCSDLAEWVKQIVEVKNGKDAINKEPMLFKMIQNLDYSDIYSRTELLEVLRVSNEKLGKMVQEIEQPEDSQGKWKLLKLQYNIIIFSKQITLGIIYAAKTKENILNFLYNWMETKNLRLEIKQGIIAALYEDLTPQNVSICQNLIRVEQEYQRELQVWSAVYNIYMQNYVDEEWRITYTEQLFKVLHINWGKKDIEAALGYWECICRSKGMYAPLFKHIF